ncbi:effector-associated constant component EACC1 [Streptomyces mirabilis]|uniref:effector-associated constant component EACC1 n=1 Tax=Streptomyces mirabilis TaxID=68239 RepID=UPI003328BE1C
MADVMQVLLVVTPDLEVDPEAAERVTRRLRSEIADLNVESVRPGPSAPTPDAAKGTDAVTVGAIIVALSASGGVFTALVETVRDWLERSSARHRVSLTIDGDTIELERASNSERRELIDAYIRRHTGS